ncbi:hypothetical protein [Pontibacter pudoricolor]|uniref:hypothetical protein n=1 Tax=Pontibacter pudoricolor TaxID=2694930 RepID=UPI001391CF24|nr:hypothetical protein [Pontibacter pudoricolor]
MDIVAIIISIIALVGAGFAFIRASSSHHILGKRIADLKERVKYLEAAQNKGQNTSSRRESPAPEQIETGRRNQSRQEQQEARQHQPREERQEQRQKQHREENQDARQRPPRQEQPPKKRERQQEFPEELQGKEGITEQQPRRKKENRRRNEPLERHNEESTGRELQKATPREVKLEFSDTDFLAELEQSAGSMPTEAMPEVVTESGIRFAIIPEDGVIRQHHLQRQPDSDSYIEIDVPAEGSNQTHYRFNLSGNHAFVISQGIDRLENAFDFEKPSNRMVSRIVQQQDGVLAKVNNGWRIQEKARIDFR